MKTGIMKKAKIYLIIALVAIAAGMTMFGVLGFNSSIDYRYGYELSIEIDQNTGNAAEVMRDAAVDYFATNGLNPYYPGTQQLDEGAQLIYKFNADVSEKKGEILTAVQSALDDKSEVKGIKATVEVYETNGASDAPFGYAVLAVGVGMIAVAIYMFIMQRISAAVATLCSGVLASALFMSLMAIIRLPASPFVAVTFAASGIIASLLSASTAHAYKEYIKNNDNGKISFAEIANEVSLGEKKKYLFTFISLLVAAAAFMAFGTMSFVIMGAQLIFAAVCGTLSAFLVTPFIWALIKGAGKNK